MFVEHLNSKQKRISISPSRLQRTGEVEWGCIRDISVFGSSQCHINKHTIRIQSDARQHEHIHVYRYIHAKPFGIEKLVQYTKCQIMILYALHDDLLLIVQFVYIFKIRISGAGGAVGGTASSCLNGRGQRSEGLLPRSPCRRRGRWPRRCHLLKHILCGSYQSITIAARWATYKNILHFWAVKYTFAAPELREKCAAKSDVFSSLPKLRHINLCWRKFQTSISSTLFNIFWQKVTNVISGTYRTFWHIFRVYSTTFSELG